MFRPVLKITAKSFFQLVSFIQLGVIKETELKSRAQVFFFSHVIYGKWKTILKTNNEKKKTNKKNNCLLFFKIFSKNFEVFDSKDEAKNSKNDFL